jgi:hypothetical protein
MAPIPNLQSRKWVSRYYAYVLWGRGGLQKLTSSRMASSVDAEGRLFHRIPQHILLFPAVGVGTAFHLRTQEGALSVPAIWWGGRRLSGYVEDDVFRFYVARLGAFEFERDLQLLLWIIEAAPRTQNCLCLSSRRRWMLVRFFAPLFALLLLSQNLVVFQGCCEQTMSA